MAARELIIVGGPNGAGKSTFALEDQLKNGGTYLGADAIAAQLSPGDPSRAAAKAGRQFLIRFQQLIRSESRLIVESTLAGKLLLRTVSAAKASGVRIKVRFIFVDSANDCVERIEQRVRNGGHSVPEIDVRRRFGRSIVNFWTQYRLLADDWLLIYNQYWIPEPVASGFGGQQFVYSETLYAQFLKLLQGQQS